jgi:uncharacterized protein (DUF2147 family)
MPYAIATDARRRQAASQWQVGRADAGYAARRMLSFSTSTNKRRWRLDEAHDEAEEYSFDEAEFEAAQRAAAAADAEAAAAAAAAAALAPSEEKAAEGTGQRQHARRKKGYKEKKAKKKKRKKRKKHKRSGKRKKRSRSGGEAVRSEDSGSDSSSSLSFGAPPGLEYWDLQSLRAERAATVSRSSGRVAEARPVQGVDINAHRR